MAAKIVSTTETLCRELHGIGLINLQYILMDGEIYVIEVNPRASRTVPYISKVTGVPMCDLATRCSLGEKLPDMGYGTGLYPPSPYVAVKVPVFSFEKLTDVDTHLGPEMKSTGEVLGIGITKAEALFKGLSAAGFSLPTVRDRSHMGVVLSVEDEDFPDTIALAKRCYDLGIHVYATKDTARAISAVGIHVTPVADPKISDEMVTLMENGSINYLIYTGAVKDDTVGDYRVLHRKAMMLGIPCMTSLDTANALADILGSRFSLENTELVDINHMRSFRDS
jgi:carbamoyl-phosphate synthase large subunit